MSETTLFLLQIAAGVSLAACAGLRAFLPLFATGLAARAGWLPLSGSFEWLSSTPALIVFGVAVGVELLSDKVPFVDHALDVLHGLLKPAAGTVLVASLLTELTPLQAVVLGIIAGGSSAGIVHLAKAKLRLGSTLFTGGLANPLVSVAEDGVSLAGTAAAILVPLLAITVLIAIAALALFVLVRITRRRRAAPTSVVVLTP